MLAWPTESGTVYIIKILARHRLMGLYRTHRPHLLALQTDFSVCQLEKTGVLSRIQGRHLTTHLIYTFTKQ